MKKNNKASIVVIAAAVCLFLILWKIIGKAALTISLIWLIVFTASAIKERFA